MKSLEHRREELLARKAALTARMAQISDEFETHEAKDWAEMATEREGDEVLEHMGLSAQQELRMIEAALHRIDEGEYGFCTKCGAPIGDARLDVLPYTPFCRNCAT